MPAYFALRASCVSIRRGYKVDIRSARFTFACYLYIYAGVAVFFLGWVRLVFSVPALVLIGLCLWQHWKRLREQDGGRVLMIGLPMLAAVGVFCVLFCLVAGQGAFFVQAGDWEKHNCVLNDLVTSHWPVCYHNDDSEAMLTYYIGQYLIPALCGKVLSSFRAAEIALLVYNAAGIFGVVLLLFRVVGADTAKKQAAGVLVLAFFGTCLFLGKALYGASGIGSSDISGAREWISDSIQLQYRTLYTDLRWVFPQAVVPWLSTLLFLENYRCMSLYCLIGAPLLLYAAFPFVGIAALMFGVAAYRFFTERDKGAVVREIFSPSNVAVAVSFLIPLVYLMGNLLGEKAPEAGFSHIVYGNNTVVYFCFAAAFLLYSAAIFREYENDLLFYLVNISLLIFPFFKMGVYNDFTMSASIPAVFLLMVFVLKALFTYGSHAAEKPGPLVFLVLLLAVGAVYPVEEMAEVIKSPVSFEGAVPGSLSVWARRDGTVGAAEAYNYFTYGYRDSMFYRFFSRKESEGWKESVRYRLGDEVFFDGPESDGYRYFPKGLSWAGDGLAWTDGMGMGFYLYIPEDVERDLELTLRFSDVYGPQQQMVVVCGDEILFESSVGEQEDPVTIPVPEGCIREHMLGLTFQFSGAVSPKEMGEGEDERKMAFALESFVLE